MRWTEEERKPQKKGHQNRRRGERVNRCKRLVSDSPILRFVSVPLSSLWLIALLLPVFFPAFVLGDDFSVVPSVSVKEDYNSNILFSSTDVRKDFITTISPAVEMVDRTGRLDTDLSVHLDRLEYADNQGLSATNQLYNGTLHYLVSPLLSVSAGAGYWRNTNPTLGIGATGIITAAVPWNHITYSTSADYQFTEKTAGTLSYSNGRDYFDNPQYLSDTTRNAAAGVVYDLGSYSPSLKGRINLGYSYYAYPNSRIDSVMGTAGISKDINEVWSVQVDGGIRNTWSKVLIPVQIIGLPLIITVPLSNEGLGWVGDVSLNYRGELGSGSFTYNRSITPAYGLNGAAEQNALTLSTQYRFSYELSALFSAGYYTLTSLASRFSAQTINQQTLRINPGVRYEFSKDMAIESSYEYDVVDNQASNTKANRQLFSVRFYIQHPFFQ